MSATDDEKKEPLVTEEERSPHVKAKSIQAIDRSAVHRICSGQVVLNLATAVKELVENSLDAGAKNIEVRLKEYGSELVEVQDNGSGVEESNFDGLTLKHHTSKLQDFSDLVNVDTFGFRGEALSSLCALSKLTVITRHGSSPVGTRLEYDAHGRLVKRTPCARQMGTTVSLANLFHSLPVRHREFQRNLKKEFAKMVQVLSAYCIISAGVQITCTNQVGKGKKNVVASTSGNPTIKENITNIFGAKQMQSMLEFKQEEPSEEACREYGLNSSKHSCFFRLSGYVSSSQHGQGRSSTDRQFYFINSRPCDPTKIIRVVNDVYHTYNRHQYPCVVLDISLDKESVDVNVTPDKRQIFIQHEKLLLATIRSSLIKMFDPISSQFQVGQAMPGKQGNQSNIFSPGNQLKSRSPLKSQQTWPSVQKKSASSTLANLKRSFSSSFAKEDAPVEESKSKQRRLDSFITQSPKPQDHVQDVSRADSDSPLASTSDGNNNSHAEGQSRLDLEVNNCDKSGDDSTTDFDFPFCNATIVNDDCAVDNKTDNTQKVLHINTDCENRLHLSSLESSHKMNNSNNECGSSSASNLRLTFHEVNEDSRTDNHEHLHEQDEGSLQTVYRTENKKSGSELDTLHQTIEDFSNDKAGNLDTSIHEQRLEDIEDEESGHIKDEQTAEPSNSGLRMVITEIDKAEFRSRKESTVPFSLTTLQSKFKKKADSEGGDGSSCRSFRAQINPSDNSAAEAELSKEIKKEMFAEMKILGQFNLGFIIVQLGEDLFIVDQHATDEKYNFEMLQRHTTIQNQRLIQPQKLELTAANETILMDNLDVFKKNGFEFFIDEDGVPTQRVKLVSMPVSKNWTFDKEDIEELIFMLTDSPGVMCRPSRVRQMFASRACRKSVMVGTALNRSEMTKLVRHMGEIEQPWNCPHGRPTMRHLINLDMIPK